MMRQRINLLLKRALFFSPLEVIKLKTPSPKEIRVAKIPAMTITNKIILMRDFFFPYPKLCYKKDSIFIGL
ncbi:hypothetical protein GQ61_06530 [Candidatus Nucleicultrix amoebiphila FS5]|uniref:Uncharacterized protein n=1 Tax=Candidatus Nucleicultrix amoebiphila FS5 TaxID=1414854 RepID=A0A1W6N5G3_9PROT|nr:hypothetical protein GQ61_06530 [Candidatus Nucleicultrix amoebiphila FS5]